MRDGTFFQPPLMILLVLKWISEAFGKTREIPFGVRRRQLGERYRADAKAEGDRIVLGGWELDGCESTASARWFSVTLGPAEIPWAYTRGAPFRSIAALELMATLLCVLLFGAPGTGPGAGLIALSASTDNKGNGFVLNKLTSTKYPLYLVLMELSAQLEERGLLLHVVWRPRDENQEADALTNETFGAFDESRRVEVEWSKLPFRVLPRLLAAAEALQSELMERKKRRPPGMGEAGPSKGTARKERLREREPW